MMRYLQKIGNFLWNLLFGEPRFKAERVTEIPDKLHPKKIYVAGEGSYLWFTAMICPCGCGEILYMNLDQKSWPNWKIEIHNDRTVTLFPSVNRTIGCRSHFYVRKGQIQWCKTIIH